MSDPLIIAVSARKGGVAAVIYPPFAVQPWFQYWDPKGAVHQGYLFESPRGVPLYLLPHLQNHVKRTSLSWAVIRGAATAASLGLVVARVLERVFHFDPGKRTQLYQGGFIVHHASPKPLPLEAVGAVFQKCAVKDWRLSAASVLISPRSLL